MFWSKYTTVNLKTVTVDSIGIDNITHKIW